MRASQSDEGFSWLGKHTCWSPEDSTTFLLLAGPGAGCGSQPRRMASKSNVDCILSMSTPNTIGADVALIPTSCKLFATKLAASVRWLLLALVLMAISTV